MAIDIQVKIIYFTTCSSILKKSVFTWRKTSCIWISGLDKRGFEKDISLLHVEYILKLIDNNGFPLVLSENLVYKLDFFINEIIKNQKEFSKSVTVEIKEIKKTISELHTNFPKNQWKRWSIRVSAFFRKSSNTAYMSFIFFIWWFIPATSKQGLKTRLN